MEERELIEQIYELVNNKEFDRDKEETSLLYRIQSDVNKFKIKYDYFNKYGVDIDVKYIWSEERLQIDDRYADIRVYRIKGDASHYICNSEEQPNNELLMCYSHGTGSYMFGGGYFSGKDYYDPELFKMYFEELKKYKYKYIDEINRSIYFDLEEGFKLYKDYKNITDKYQKIFNERLNKHRIKDLKKQMKELEVKNGN